jgi:hypothetical protein
LESFEASRCYWHAPIWGINKFLWFIFF